MSFVVGQRIVCMYAQWGSLAEYYPGVIAAANADGTFDVAYDDGEKQTSVGTAKLMDVEEAKAKGIGQEDEEGGEGEGEWTSNGASVFAAEDDDVAAGGGGAEEEEAEEEATAAAATTGAATDAAGGSGAAERPTGLPGSPAADDDDDDATAAAAADDDDDDDDDASCAKRRYHANHAARRRVTVLEGVLSSAECERAIGAVEAAAGLFGRAHAAFATDDVAAFRLAAGDFGFLAAAVRQRVLPALSRASGIPARQLYCKDLFVVRYSCAAGGQVLTSAFSLFCSFATTHSIYSFSTTPTALLVRGGRAAGAGAAPRRQRALVLAAAERARRVRGRRHALRAPAADGAAVQPRYGGAARLEGAARGGGCCCCCCCSRLVLSRFSSLLTTNSSAHFSTWCCPPGGDRERHARGARGLRGAHGLRLRGGGGGGGGGRRRGQRVAPEVERRTHVAQHLGPRRWGQQQQQQRRRARAAARDRPSPRAGARHVRE
jgi:hypothetical protein